MPPMVSTGARRASLVTGALVALVLAGLLSWWRHDPDAAGSASGPLTISAGRTELVFPAPAGADDWSVTVGSFLLCAPAGELTLTKVAPLKDSGLASFTSVTRAFRIEHRRAPVVAEPIIGAYGVPPQVGGVHDPAESRLYGDLAEAVGRSMELPSCQESTGAPGDPAMELMLVVAAGRPGASVDGVLVEYEAGGHEYEAEIPVTLTLCGTHVHDPDC